MTEPNLSFVDPSVQSSVYLQSYAKNKPIEGVKLIPLKAYTADEGDFCEILRFSAGGKLEGTEDFEIRQINRTRLFPGSIKAWHVHRLQDEIWYVPPAFHLVVGLWDIRNGSASFNSTMKFVLGGGVSQLLFVPKGVAHGSVNHSNQEIELFYFVNQQFNLENPDEHRIHWDHLGADFWLPERD